MGHITGHIMGHIMLHVTVQRSRVPSQKIHIDLCEIQSLIPDLWRDHKVSFRELAVHSKDACFTISGKKRESNEPHATTTLKLDGGGFEPPAFLAAALAAACCSASCLAARNAALLFVLVVILGAAILLGRGFNFEADDRGRRSPLLLVPLGLLWPFR